MKKISVHIALYVVMILASSSFVLGCPMCDKTGLNGTDTQYAASESESGTSQNPHQFLVDEIPKVNFVWKTPDGWNETLGKGLRIATFKPVELADQSIECRLLQLSGEAGGLKANVKLWMQQLGLAELPDEQLDAFIAKQSTFTTDGNLEGTKIDFSTLLTKPDQADTMVVAVIPVDGATVFVKITGSVAGIKKYQSQFQALCQSIKRAA
ncbi:MAG: hypothetical protein Q8Q33_01215 [Chlamydiota bacterium]|nr:hypothetical protein [Chlamydiota bacterium]